MLLKIKMSLRAEEIMIQTTKILPNCKVIEKVKKNSKQIDLKLRTNRQIEGFTDLLENRIDSLMHTRKVECQAKNLELE